MTKGEDDGGVTAQLEVRAIGNDVGLIFPQDLLSHLHLKAGDTLRVVERTDGSLLLRVEDPVHARGMELARQAFRDYAETFKALAK